MNISIHRVTSIQVNTFTIPASAEDPTRFPVCYTKTLVIKDFYGNTHEVVLFAVDEANLEIK